MNDNNDSDAEVKELAWQIAKVIDKTIVDDALWALALVARVAIDKMPESERSTSRFQFARRIGALPT